MTSAGGTEVQQVGVATHLLPMRWWHVQQVCALEHQVFGPTTAWTAEDFYAEIAAPHRWLQVLCEQGAAGSDSDAAVVGYVDVSVQGRDADLMTVVVAPSHRGQGLGAALLDAGVAWARECQAHHMFLEVDPDNPAHGLYVSRGFSLIDRRRAYYADGRDALVMRLALQHPGGHG